MTDTLLSDLPTPKQRLKEHLRSSGDGFRYYKSLFNAIPDLVALSDGDRIIDANAAFARFFAGEGLDVFAPDFSLSSLFLKVDRYGYVYDGYGMRRWFDTVLQKEKKLFRVAIAPQSKRYDFHITVRPFEPAEEIYIITLSDISELADYKNTLEENFRSMTHDKNEALTLLQQYDRAINIANLVSKSNLDGTITYVNDAFCEMLGYCREELLGDNILIFCIPDEDDMGYESVWDIIEAGNTWKGVIQNVDKKGKILTFDTTIVPLTNSTGEVVEYLTIRNDITEMVEAKEEAVRTLKAKTKFFDQISHELRTPLNAIINFTDQAMENYDDAFEDETLCNLVKIYLERAYKNSQSLLHLINSLLDMAKLQSGQETFAIERYDAVSIAMETYENCSGLYNNDKIEYRFNKEMSFLWIHCDPLKLRQILTNLISNAFKFTRNGFIEVRIFQQENRCVIEVEDTGSGIPAHKLDSIFQPFQQARTGDVGTGLGLSIVREYCQGMGIDLHVQSKEGQGSCFRLSTPTIPQEGTQWTI